MLEEISASMKSAVCARRVVDEQFRLKSSPSHPVTIAESVTRAFDEAWLDPEQRLWMCPAKEVLNILDERLQLLGFKSVSPRALSLEMTVDEIPEEVAELLSAVDSVASDFI